MQAIKPGDINLMVAGKGIVHSERERLEVTAKEDSRIALIGGEKLAQRHNFWNFASSSKEPIERAKEDWKANLFPSPN